MEELCVFLNGQTSSTLASSAEKALLPLWPRLLRTLTSPTLESAGSSSSRKLLPQEALQPVRIQRSVSRWLGRRPTW
ncbi:hypothetical protein VPNG_07142 [Cytospora leucostoma]|uniref:Uncharacterized protein n=1 Tax=Cytospora leucostoma TaxID=1230097 RepID=A0A423WV92_9PEZI|nr:hypothetical protein VPNG_07142 [Cytospora leucostoma]